MEVARILVADRSDVVAGAVRAATGRLALLTELVTCTRIGGLRDVVTGAAPFDVLVVGPALMTRAGLARVADIHDADPALTVALAVAGERAVPLRDLVRAGATEVLDDLDDAAAVAACLQRGIERRRRLLQPAAALVPAPEPASGTTFTVASATGGCGKTFYATNLAYFLARHTGKRVCIADFDLQFGEVTAALRLRPRFTSHDLVEQLDDADLDAHIEEYLVTHETGVWVLASPQDPSEADRFTPKDVIRIIDALCNRFDYVVVDTPAQLNEVVLALFDRSELLFTLASFDLPSVRNLSVFLTTLQRLKFPAESVRLVMNKADDNVGMDLDQVVKLFPQGFSSILPYSREASRSINLGLPVLAADPASEVSRELTAGMSPLLPEGLVVEVAPARKSRARWFHRLTRSATGAEDCA